MNKLKFILLLLSFSFFLFTLTSFAQEEEEEQIVYYQMEPLDDSLFVKIQLEVFIDPPDPKAEIIVDLRDPANQTVTIKSVLYPFLAFTPETRARIVTYPFKINLLEQINYGSVFTRVIEKIKLNRLFDPPTLTQISSSLYYINPFFQLQGGERFGIPIKKDIGLSFGVGTPYSGPLETNIIEVNFHILGLRAGLFTNINAMTQLKDANNHNNIYSTSGFQLGYVIPLGNFFEVGYQKVTSDPNEEEQKMFDEAAKNNKGYKPLILDGSYFNWEFRYPLKVMGSTRAKFYVANFLQEWHIGFSGRELSVAGNTFDFRFDSMVKSKVRNPQYVLEVLVQKIFESWAFSAMAIGPALIMSKTDSGNFGVTSLLLNLRFKVGTSL